MILNFWNVPVCLRKELITLSRIHAHVSCETVCMYHTRHMRVCMYCIMRNICPGPGYSYSVSSREFGRPVRASVVEPPAVARYSAEDEHLQGFLARARNVVSRDGRRPIAFSGARSEAVPRARSGSLTVCRLLRTGAKLTTIVAILFWTWTWISQSEFSLRRLELSRYRWWKRFVPSLGGRLSD